MDHQNKRLFQLCTAQIFLESDMTAIANEKKNEVVNKIRILPFGGIEKMFIPNRYFFVFK